MTLTPAGARTRDTSACVSEAAPPEPVQHHVHHRRAPRKRLHRPALQGRCASPEVGGRRLLPACATLRLLPPSPRATCRGRRRRARCSDKEAEAQSRDTALPGPPSWLLKDRPASLCPVPPRNQVLCPVAPGLSVFCQGVRDPVNGPDPGSLSPFLTSWKPPVSPESKATGEAHLGMRCVPVNRCLAHHTPSLRSRGGSRRATNTG